MITVEVKTIEGRLTTINVAHIIMYEPYGADGKYTLVTLTHDKIVFVAAPYAEVKKYLDKLSERG